MLVVSNEWSKGLIDRKSNEFYAIEEIGDDLNRSSTKSLFHIEMSKTYVANGKKFGLVDRNRISCLHNCNKGSC